MVFIRIAAMYLPILSLVRETKTNYTIQDSKYANRPAGSSIILINVAVLAPSTEDIIN